ncbi:MAG: nuclear transport factor 2 family protein [Thermaerobacter sp.]|nr:nuclear transport factor 2 family protein [Thermaerobacter sp.]
MEDLMRTLLEQYVEGWKSRHIEAVLSTLANDCVVTECYGPVYKSHDRVRQWMATWFAAGGRVLEWDIRSFVGGRNAAAIEWTFRCWWREDEFAFDGASVARFDGGKIATLREYTTTAPLYEWQGEWIPQNE